MMGNSDLIACMEPVALAIWGKPSERTKTQLRFGSKGSVAVDLTTGTWYDHEAGEGGGVLAALKRRMDGIHCDRDAFKWLEEHRLYENGDDRARPQANGAAHKRSTRTGPVGELIATYPYTDERAALLFEVQRFLDHATGTRHFRQRHQDVSGQWVNSIKGVRRVPYRVLDLIAARDAGKTILIVEGEKDVDNCYDVLGPATCNPMGAGSWPKMAEQINPYFANADVVIIGDNDDAGRAHAIDVASALRPVARRVRVIDIKAFWPACPHKGDISDWIAADGDGDAFWNYVESAPAWTPNGGEKRKDNGKNRTISIKTAATLRTKEFAAITYIVPGYIVEGCTILAGRPKLGKSWLMLDIGLAVARGGCCLGNVRCTQGDVLYLALEDNERRLQNRMTRLMGFGSEWPEHFHYATEWPRAEAGGLDEIRKWITAAKNPRLIVVDILAMFRSPRRKDQQPYENDYAAIQGLQAIASETGVAIVVVHHLRKSAGEVDPFEKVSGTLGLSGAADTVLILDRDGQGSTLYGRGRDIEEIETAVQFSRELCRWHVVGAAAEIRRTDERTAILDVLKEAEEAMSPGDIADATGTARNSVKQLLFKMAKAGEVAKARRGRYRHLELVIDNQRDNQADNQFKGEKDVGYRLPSTPDNHDNHDNQFEKDVFFQEPKPNPLVIAPNKEVTAESEPITDGYPVIAVTGPPITTDNQRELPSDAIVVGSASPGERCFSCGKASGVFLIRRRKGEPADPRHKACAAQAWTAEEPP
jgi:AAA domain/IclR helix-turn-helix domain